MYALSAPVPKLDADSAALPVGIKVFFVIVFTFTTDRMGRRTIVIVLAGICCAMLLVIGILGHVTHNEATKVVLIVAACIWSAANVGCKSAPFICAHLSSNLHITVRADL